jgi:hypothetical protein
MATVLQGIANIASGGLFAGINGLIDRIKGKSPEDAAKLAELAQKYQSELLAADVEAMKGQVEIDKIEAANSNLFVAGWRPFIGWVCGVGLATQFLIGPLFTWIAAMFGKTVVFPVLDLGTLATLLFGMLGLSGMRTVEKVNGVKAGH